MTETRSWLLDGSLFNLHPHRLEAARDEVQSKMNSPDLVLTDGAKLPLQLGVK